MISMPGSTFQLMLEWAYTGGIKTREVSIDAVMELYFYAETYEMKHLMVSFVFTKNRLTLLRTTQNI